MNTRAKNIASHLDKSYIPHIAVAAVILLFIALILGTVMIQEFADIIGVGGTCIRFSRVLVDWSKG